MYIREILIRMGIPAVAAVTTVAFLSTGARAAESYKIDPVHSNVFYKIKHLGTANTYGRFDDFSGTITMDTVKPTLSAVDFTVQVDSVDTHAEKRDEHLKSPDFFNAKQFPTMSFKSISVKKVDANNVQVTGNFTLHGVTKPLTVKVHHVGSGKNPKSGNPMVGWETTFTISRKAYGISFMPDGLGDDVTVTVAVEADKV